MQLHEAIDILKSLNNESTGICDKEKCDELIAIETFLQELYHTI